MKKLRHFIINLLCHMCQQALLHKLINTYMYFKDQDTGFVMKYVNVVACETIKQAVNKH